jgi:hypothetical protein
MAREFRVYLLDVRDHFVKAHTILADSDDEASDKALELTKTGGVEIWEGSRLVARLPRSE